MGQAELTGRMARVLEHIERSRRGPFSSEIRELLAEYKRQQFEAGKYLPR